MTTRTVTEIQADIDAVIRQMTGLNRNYDEYRAFERQRAAYVRELSEARSRDAQNARDNFVITRKGTL